ncbi:MarR family winged helix-turn-helix transcriptional regulator [Pantoea sp. Z09]|uniref:MarR family winged helix-turn-helix transcriptional regulator n=1 Tax=Pantoea sp. Z09 TaxID=2886821 RepID=UPI001EFC65E3|nr:MarR family transcriptional regulator [Pantoea sp. Z09]
MPSPHDESTLQLAEALRRSVSTFVRQVRVATATPRTSQLETLELLETHGAITIAELARLRGVKHQSMRLVIQELESQGYITRQPNPQDARAQHIALTETARALLRDAREQRARWIADLLTEKLDAPSRDALINGIAALNKLVD